jgi:cellulose synthase/poly-beta-1,6-N-acetylglucosamine synthase-like glycosyltransferase
VGTEKAKGDVILFLDSDMILYPDFIEKNSGCF